MLINENALSAASQCVLIDFLYVCFTDPAGTWLPCTCYMSIFVIISGDTAQQMTL